MFFDLTGGLGAVLFTCLWIWIFYSPVKPIIRTAYMATSLGFLLFCVYRVYQVREHVKQLMHEQLSFPALLAETRERAWTGLKYVMPVQFDTPAGPYVALAVVLLVAAAFWAPLLALTRSRSRADVIGLLFSFPMTLFALFVLAIVSVSIPSGYPPRLSPRYVFPAAAILALLTGIGSAQLLRRVPVIGVLAAAYLLLAAPNVMFKREREWWALNEMFSTLVNRIQERAEAGDAIYVAGTTEFSRTILRFFGPDGRRLFGRHIGNVRAYSPNVEPRGRFVLVDFSSLSSRLDHLDHVVERIEAVTPHVATTTGFSRLTRFWEETGQWLGSSANPYFESGTIDLNRRPLMYLYDVCPKSAGTECRDVRLDAVRFGELCSRLDPKLLPAGIRQDGATHIQGDRENFRYSFDASASRSHDLDLVVPGRARISQEIFRIQLWKADALLWEGWTFPSREFTEFDATSPILPANSGSYRVDLFVYPGKPAALEITCPFPILGIPVHVLRAPIRYGSFSG